MLAHSVMKKKERIMMHRLVFLVLMLISLGLTQTNEDCMVCHTDPDLTGLNKVPRILRG